MFCRFLKLVNRHSCFTFHLIFYDDGFQGQHDELQAKFFEERAALEAKYQKLYEPLYTKVQLFYCH